MSGVALVTINENQWAVEVATTYEELTTGLAGRESLPAGTGMLFIPPERQVITVNTTQMLFALDIIFILNDTVLSIARNIQPGYLVTEDAECDGFLEVNANETGLVEVGDVIITEFATPPPASGFDFSSIIAFAIPLAVLGFFLGVLGPLGGSSSNNPKKLSNPGKTYKVDDIKVTIEHERSGVHLVTIKPPGGRVVSEEEAKKIDKLLQEKAGDKYYWEIIDIDTGEIMQKGKPYTTIGKVYAAARSFQRSRAGKDKENLVVIRIYDNPNMEEWNKTIKPVMESGMHRGIKILIGKTPLQEEALDRLWPYGILEIHSDGDLTVFSQGKKWVVTTEGGVFKEEDVIPSGGHMIEIPLGGREVELKAIGARIHKEGKTLPMTDEWHALRSEKERQWMIDGWQESFEERRGKMEPSDIRKVPIMYKTKKETLYLYGLYGTKEQADLEAEWIRSTKSVSVAVQKVFNEWAVYKEEGGHHSIHGEPRRRLVEKYGSWAVGRAEAVCGEDDVACVTREAKRLIETVRTRHGEEAMEYVTILTPGQTILHYGDVVSLVALEKENRRVRVLGENEATWQ